MKRFFIVALLAGALGVYASRPSPLTVEAAPPALAMSAISVAEPPLQRDPDTKTAFRVNGYQLQPLQSFALKARVLAVEHYRWDREADLSPTDVAFGWGRMADAAVVERLSISQSGRWYHWRYSGAPPLPPPEISRSSANMHLIPASRQIAQALRDVRPGKTVSLQGYLVQARGPDGWSWSSSLTRDDTGSGSCELVFVQAFQVH